MTDDDATVRARGADSSAKSPAAARRVAARVAARSARGIAIAFAVCGALELGLILGDFSYPALDEPIVVVLPDGRIGSETIHTFDTACLWIPAPGAQLPWGEDERVNADGYRGPRIPRERNGDTLRIATLGDSSTFGHSVAFEECYTALVRDLVGERTGRTVEVLDAGVIGYSVRQGLERWRVFVRDYRPDIVIAAFGAVNEHVAAMGLPDDELIRTHAWDGNVVVQWARRLRRDLRLTHVSAYLADALRGGRVEIRRMNRERELAIRPSLYTLGDADWSGTRRVSYDEFEHFMLTLRDEVVETGARFVALSMPRRIRVEELRPALLQYTQRLTQMAADGEFELVDGRAALGRAISREVWPRDLLVDDYHPSALGHAALAAALADALVGAPVGAPVHAPPTAEDR